jgi:hypothetical protein
MEKLSNGMKFARWQVPIRLIYAGTVHRSEGMNLDRAVIDLRSHFWKHGQVHVTLSIVTDRINLCFLSPGSSNLRGDIDPTEKPIRIPVDGNFPHIISILYSGVGDGHVSSSEDQPLSTGEWSEPQHSVPVQLSDQYQGNVNDMSGIHNGSQDIPPD